MYEKNLNWAALWRSAKIELNFPWVTRIKDSLNQQSISHDQSILMPILNVECETLHRQHSLNTSSVPIPKDRTVTLEKKKKKSQLNRHRKVFLTTWATFCLQSSMSVLPWPSVENSVWRETKVCWAFNNNVRGRKKNPWQCPPAPPPSVKHLPEQTLRSLPVQPSLPVCDWLSSFHAVHL